jgi:hypothetical protein
MSLADDITQAIDESEQAKDTRIIWPAVVNTVDPLTVTIDGSGASVPCKAFGGLTLTPNRRIGVIMLGTDLVVFGAFGSDVTFEDLTLSDDLIVMDTTYLNKIQWGLANPAISKATGTSGNLTAPNTTFTSMGLGMTFVAPPSGRVDVKFGARVYTTTANGSCCVSPYVKVGNVIDSGADHATPNDVYAVELFAPTTGAYFTGGASRLIEGLTSGVTYNVNLYHKSSPAGSGGSTKGTVSVIPAW